MKNYKINHELNQYDYSEGIEFDGLIPEMMNTDGIETIGANEKSVKYFGFDAKGSDSLEVIDIEKFFENNPQPKPEPFTPVTYYFVSYGDSEGTTEYGKGSVETTDDTTYQGYTKIKIKENPSYPEWEGTFCYIVSTATPNNGTIYQLSKENENKLELIDVWVKIYTIQPE